MNEELRINARGSIVLGIFDIIALIAVIMLFVSGYTLVGFLFLAAGILALWGAHVNIIGGWKNYFKSKKDGTL